VPAQHHPDGFNVPLWKPKPLRLLIDNENGAIAIATPEQNHCVMGEPIIQRREAERLAVKFIGTLGLLQQGLTSKWITDAEAIGRVMMLCNGGFRIPRPVPHHTFAEYSRTLN
jgi:predicted nucleic acid-binding protein